MNLIIKENKMTPGNPWKTTQTWGEHGLHKGLSPELRNEPRTLELRGGRATCCLYFIYTALKHLLSLGHVKPANVILFFTALLGSVILYEGSTIDLLPHIWAHNQPRLVRVTLTRDIHMGPSPAESRTLQAKASEWVRKVQRAKGVRMVHYTQVHTNNFHILITAEILFNCKISIAMPIFQRKQQDVNKKSLWCHKVVDIQILPFYTYTY